MGKAKKKTSSKAKKNDGARSGATRAAKGAPVSPIAVSTPTDASMDAALAQVIGRARSLGTRDVRVVSFGGSLAVHNAQIGVRNVLAREADAQSQLRTYDHDAIAGVGTLALAFAACSRGIDRSGLGIGALYAKLAPLRAAALASAQSCATMGLIDAKVVRRIEKGTGKIDGAQDGVDLAGVLAPLASDRGGKIALSSAQLTEMRDLGNQLLVLLNAKGAKKKVTPQLADAIDLRNRVGTLLVAAWDQLWKAGAVVWGKDEVDANVPSLQSTVHARKGKKVQAAGATSTTATAAS